MSMLWMVCYNRTMSSEIFQNALSGFVTDVAVGDTVRALVLKGYSVSGIKRYLDYPVSEEKLRQMVWNCLIDTGVIRLAKPGSSDAKRGYTYERDRSPYGTVTYRRVASDSERTEPSYLPCDFGSLRKKDPGAFEKSLQALLPEDREYILDLPWPVSTVWHAENERMKRIMSTIKKESNTR